MQGEVRKDRRTALNEHQIAHDHIAYVQPLACQSCTIAINFEQARSNVFTGILHKIISEIRVLFVQIDAFVSSESRGNGVVIHGLRR